MQGPLKGNSDCKRPGLDEGYHACLVRPCCAWGMAQSINAVPNQTICTLARAAACCDEQNQCLQAHHGGDTDPPSCADSGQRTPECRMRPGPT